MLLCEHWNDQKNTVNRSPFQNKIFFYKINKILLYFLIFTVQILKKFRLRRGAYAAGAPTRRAHLRGERSYADGSPTRRSILWREETRLSELGLWVMTGDFEIMTGDLDLLRGLTEDRYNMKGEILYLFQNTT